MADDSTPCSVNRSAFKSTMLLNSISSPEKEEKMLLINSRV